MTKRKPSITEVTATVQSYKGQESQTFTFEIISVGLSDLRMLFEFEAFIKSRTSGSITFELKEK